jgi:hypothetical protein
MQSTLYFAFNSSVRLLANGIGGLQLAIYKLAEAPVRSLQNARRPHNHFPYTPAQLALMPPGTVGWALHSWLTAHRIGLIPKYENHDLQHLLLGYGPHLVGEYCLHAFMWGNGHRTFLTGATLAMGYVTVPQAWGRLRRATRRGRQTVGKVYLLDFNALPAQPLHAVLGALGLLPH